MNRPSRLRPLLAAAVLLALLAPLSACLGDRAGRDFAHPNLPFYGKPAPPVAAASAADTLRVVTFNVRYGRRLGRALVELGWQGEGAPEIVLLQEMTGAGAAAIADSLGLGFVYYPAVIHPAHRREFGNAVLSRFPIVGHGKIILPYPDPTGQRIAVRAELDVAGRRLLVYSVHLGVLISPEQRREQLSVVLRDLGTRGEGPAIIGGDLNTVTRSHLRGTRRLLRRAGLREATARVPWSFELRALGITFLRAALDHIFVRGLEATGAGLAERDAGASDHRAVWTRLVLPATGDDDPHGAAGGPEVPWASSSRSRRPSPGPAPSSSSSAPARASPPTPSTSTASASAASSSP